MVSSKLLKSKALSSHEMTRHIKNRFRQLPDASSLLIDSCKGYDIIDNFVNSPVYYPAYGKDRQSSCSLLGVDDDRAIRQGSRRGGNGGNCTTSPYGIPPTSKQFPPPQIPDVPMGAGEIHSRSMIEKEDSGLTATLERVVPASSVTMTEGGSSAGPIGGNSGLGPNNSN